MNLLKPYPALGLALSILAGLFLGSLVNMAFITLGSAWVPLPAGVDPNNADSIASHIHLYEPKHLLFPFLAHALGTFVGALVAVRLSPRRNWLPAIVVALFFGAGGVTMMFWIPAPWWFGVLDLGLAYLPMGVLGYLSGRKITAAIS